MHEENILVFCAHSDDQILGPGGTLAKYAKEGKKIYTYIFSYGETSHPHFKRQVIVKLRVDEAKKADEEIKGSGIVFFGLHEGRFLQEAKRLRLKRKIKKIITEKDAVKIFTHNSDDPHTDHRAVNNIIMECLEEIRSKADVYAFDIWNPLSIRYRRNPQLIVNISKEFRIKIKALTHFRSQRLAMLTLLWSVYTKALKNGIIHGYKLAEVFYKIR